VIQVMMEEGVTELVGSKGRHDPSRAARLCPVDDDRAQAPNADVSKSC
jgi:hypothetical protein